MSTQTSDVPAFVEFKKEGWSGSDHGPLPSDAVVFISIEDATKGQILLEIARALERLDDRIIPLARYAGFDRLADKLAGYASVTRDLADTVYADEPPEA